MRVLLDTHAFIWWITDDERLTSSARETIGGSSGEVFVSAASVWEMVTKSRLGRLRVAERVDRFVPAHLEANEFQPLAITVRHALELDTLPDIHRDPFDRILIAQARSEEMPLVSGDRAIHAYPVTTIW